MLKCHFSPKVKIGETCCSRGRAWFAFSFLLNKVGDLSFFLAWFHSLTPPLYAVILKIYVRKKGYRERSIRSHHSWTQIFSSRSRTRGIFVVSAFQDVCPCHKTNITLFLLNNTIHLFCYFKNYVKAVLFVPAKRSVNRWNKLVLDRWSRND